MIDGVALVSLPDLAAMKLNAIANRGSKKDFHDLAELLGTFSLPAMLGLFSEKYPATDSFAVIRSLAWYEDAENEPDVRSLNGRSWGEVKALVRESVSKL